ncbi:hypothetical protein ACFW4M_29540 [Streptomyces sp. NPDC058794]|uniref:hypothetical protein n=1 Tax=unclassified Streptomyces TaxID=2593676 RepID=UPI0036A8FB46
MSQRGRHTRAVSLLRCALAMVTVVVAVLCAAGAGRSPAAAEEFAVAGSSAAVAALAVDRAPGDEVSPAAPRPCEKKGLAEQSSTRGDLRVPETPAPGTADSAAQRGTAPSPAVRATAGPAPPASCASAASTTVLRI